MVVIRPVTIETIASIAVRRPGIPPWTAPNVRIPPVDIYIPAVVDVDIGIPAALVYIYPVVGVPVPGSGDIGGPIPGGSVDNFTSVSIVGFIPGIGSTPVRSFRARRWPR